MNTHVHGWALVDQLAQVERVVHDHESGMLWFWRHFAAPPGYSRAMVSDKSAALQDSGAVEFVTADGGCLLNIKRQAGPRWQSLSRQASGQFSAGGTHRRQGMSAATASSGKLRAAALAQNPSRARCGWLRAPRHVANTLPRAWRTFIT